MLHATALVVLAHHGLGEHVEGSLCRETDLGAHLRELSFECVVNAYGHCHAVPFAVDSYLSILFIHYLLMDLNGIAQQISVFDCSAPA